MNFLKKSSSSGEAEANKPSALSRRTFLTDLGVGAFLLAMTGTLYSFLRSLVPNVLYEAPRRFKIGRADQFPEGMTYLEDKRLYVFKEGKTFYAISAVCTHLGCTAKYVHMNKPERVTLGGVEREYSAEFQCPCHGSKFYGDGTNYAGPAPRPLPWYKLEVSPDDGQLVVNTAAEVDQNTRLAV
jgi:cytochrome b6-f complex iron-sulfur subunit